MSQSRDRKRAVVIIVRQRQQDTQGPRDHQLHEGIRILGFRLIILAVTTQGDGFPEAGSNRRPLGVSVFRVAQGIGGARQQPTSVRSPLVVLRPPVLGYPQIACKKGGNFWVKWKALLNQLKAIKQRRNRTICWELPSYG